MSLNKTITALLFMLLATLTAQAAGIEAQLATCNTCHGSKGEGNAALFAPALAGQRVEYIARQLHAFKNGIRGENPDDKHGATMRGIAAGLSDEAIGELAAHFAALPAVAPQITGKGDAAAGKELYIATCSACHGLRAEGYMQLQTPNLRILGTSYLTDQMGSYVKGWRGASPKSAQPAVWMNSIANQILDPTELANIFAYVGTLTK